MQSMEGKPPVISISVEYLNGLVAPWPAEMELEPALAAAAALLEELCERMSSAATETTSETTSEWVSTLASHRVVGVISIIVALTKFCRRG